MIDWNGRPRFIPQEATIFSRIVRTGFDPAKPFFLSPKDLAARVDPARGRCFMYRGQVHPWHTCYSSLFRKQPNTEWQFKALLAREKFKIAELELVMKNHPFTNIAKQHGFWVDYHGLGQHYGIATSLLDLTTDLHVAAFFAVATWNDQQNRFVPACDSDGDGIIYRFDWTKLPSNFFEPVGFGPGLRPARQHAWTFRLHPQMDFALAPHVEARQFKHDGAASRKIFEWFDDGSWLYPEDCLASVVRKVEVLPFITLGAVRHAALQDGVAEDQLEAYADRAAEFLNALLGIDFIDGYSLEIDDDDLKKAKEQAENLSENIHRMSKGWRLVRSSASH